MDLIKTLRDKTGAGISECKKALDEAKGNIEKAIEILRKKGIARAAKRGDREVCEGAIKVMVNDAGDEGYIVEVNAETDFAARSDEFQDFSDKVMETVKTGKPTSVEELMNMKLDGGTVKDNLDNLSGVIGEKLDIKRCDVLTGETVAGYSHMGGKIGVLVALNKPGEIELAREIAMQVAAANPQYIKPEDVPQAEIDKEKEIYVEQLKKEGSPRFGEAGKLSSDSATASKPENIIEKILEGKINKYFEEICLIKQEYNKDDKKRVEDILGDVRVERFIRYSL
jgi:elongation factor Ts